MKWGEFKRAVEAGGVTDDHEISYIDVSSDLWVKVETYQDGDGDLNFNVTDAGKPSFEHRRPYDDLIDDWHVQRPEGITLDQYLGMTKEEYGRWLLDPNFVPEGEATVKLGFIEMTPVESKRIVSIGYDEQSETLAVEFPKNRNQVGGLYYYFKFPAAKFAEFQAAPDKGEFLELNIKNAPYVYRRAAHIVLEQGREGIVWIQNDCGNCGDRHIGNVRCNEA